MEQQLDDSSVNKGTDQISRHVRKGIHRQLAISYRASRPRLRIIPRRLVEEYFLSLGLMASQQYSSVIGPQL